MKKILKYEFKQLIRDKKTVFFVFILPVILFPLSGLIPRFVTSRIEKLVEEKFTVVSDDTDFLKEIFSGYENDSLITVDFTQVGERTDSLLKKYPAVVTSELSDSLGIDVVTISYSAKKDKESIRASLLTSRLKKERRVVVEERFAGIGVSDYYKSSVPKIENSSTPAEMSNAEKAGFIPISVIMILLIGTFMISNYVILGEKDNNTLESLLSSGVERNVIVYGKVGMVIIIGLTMSVLQMLSFFLYVTFLGAGGENISLSFLQLMSLALMALTLSVLISSTSVMVSCRLKSSSSGQILFMPLMILFAVLSLFGTFDGVVIEKGFLFLPIANSAGMIKAVVTDRFSFLTVVAVSFVNLVYSGIVIKYASEYLSGEEVLDKSSDIGTAGGGISKSGVFTVFALLLVVYMIAGGYLQSRDLVSGLVYSQIIILGGFSALMFYNSKSSFNSYFRIKMPDARYIIAAIFIGITARFPISLITEQLSYFFPVPDIFNNFDILGTAIGSLSLTSAILVIAVLPAVFEESVFRGAIFSSLEKKYSKAGLAVVTGIMFGMMHLNIYNLFETSVLGVLFGLLTVYSGSILPAVAAHFVNNAFSVSVMKLVGNGLISENDPLLSDIRIVWAMTAVFALSIMLIFWKKKN